MIFSRNRTAVTVPTYVVLGNVLALVLLALASIAHIIAISFTLYWQASSSSHVIALCLWSIIFLLFVLIQQIWARVSGFAHFFEIALFVLLSLIYLLCNWLQYVMLRDELSTLVVSTQLAFAIVATAVLAYHTARIMHVQCPYPSVLTHQAAPPAQHHYAQNTVVPISIAAQVPLTPSMTRQTTVVANQTSAIIGVSDDQ